MTMERFTSQLNRGRTVVFLAVGWIAFANPALFSQANTSAAAVTPQAVDAGMKPMTFEAASIRSGKFGDYSGHGIMADGIDYKGVTPLALIIIAYRFTDTPRISGLPDWCRTEFYNVYAKVADSDVPERSKVNRRTPDPALQALLEDRFSLKVHLETRDTVGYALVVAKNGPKLKESTPGDTYPNGDRLPDGNPMLGANTGVVSPGPHDRLTGQAASMSSLAAYLGSVLGRPVADKTGLKGKYDYTMPLTNPGPDNEDPGDLATMSSVFATLPDYLGLRLEPTKAPMRFLIVDHIEKPSAN